MSAGQSGRPEPTRNFAKDSIKSLNCRETISYPPFMGETLVGEGHSLSNTQIKLSHPDNGAWL